MSKPALKRQVIEETEPARLAVAPAPDSRNDQQSQRPDRRRASPQRYLRAMTERKIQGIAPATQQDIVAEAMVDWLKKHGYFR